MSTQEQDHIVELYEDNGGGLHAVCGEVVYSGFEYVEGGSFAVDAQAIIDGETQDWSLSVTPVDDWIGDYGTLIATYDGAVHIQPAHIGRAGEIYLGL